MGDLTTDLSPRGSNNTLGKSLKRVLNRNGLVHVNVIKDYTCITECTKSLIDLFITSIKSKVKLCGTFDTSIDRFHSRDQRLGNRRYAAILVDQKKTTD